MEPDQPARPQPPTRPRGQPQPQPGPGLAAAPRFGWLDLPRCPYLPVPDAPLTPSSTRRFRGGERGAAFYEAALLYAQSLWLEGFPAKALLLVNRAMGADVGGDEPVLSRWPVPYAATAWIMRARRPEQFIGNPRRHFQHLATRMVEPRKELRTWRAWGCWLLATEVFPDYPADEMQIRNEGVELPSRAEVIQRIGALGLPGETSLLEAAESVARGGDSA